ncbi:MAG: DUF296 domain-containing protein [Chitinophagaceae bacterium]|nr:MAG: DUF296 domain-containing protein [Chitinophagaceae bacterium]
MEIRVQDADTLPKYIRTSNGYTMVLRKGENVLESIKQLASKEKIIGASYTGFGFVEAEFGYFNNRTKVYDPRKVTGELASLTGSIAWNADTVSLHTHAIVTDSTFLAYGGHLLGAVVGTGSVELFVAPGDVPLGRKVEQPLGANVLQLPAAKK